MTCAFESPENVKRFCSVDFPQQTVQKKYKGPLIPQNLPMSLQMSIGWILAGSYFVTKVVL